MPKRISKKLLVGLGSTVTFSTVGVIAGFGIKSIVNADYNHDLFNQINKIDEANFDQAPDYNKATPDMFFDTTHLKSFHFGNVQRGQTITPYGWLGVFEPGQGIARKIALTGWNGEILWVNDDYADQNNETRFNVYDMKYDFNTDLIFVARTNSDNGVLNSNGSTASVILDVLDAKTGIKKDSTDISQTSAAQFLTGKYINMKDPSHRNRSKNLYSLDVISKPGTNDAIVTWTPNFLQLTLRTNSPQTEGANARDHIMPLIDIVDGYYSMVTNFIFTKTSTNVQHATRKFNVRKTYSFQSNPSQPGWYPDWDNKRPDFNSDYLTEYFPIANPFITMKNNNFILHLLVAKKNASKILHKIIEFNSNGSYPGGSAIDKSENITNKLPILSDGTWAKSNDWSSDFAKANLRINRNMFDTNSVVFAFPYAAGGSPTRLPIFNVAQLLINSSNGEIINWNIANATKKSMVLPFGKEIVDYWKANSPLYNSNSSVNKIYPFAQANQTNLNHNYHRLITVSPFDNTVLYASKPNMTNDIFNQSNNNESKWANFWIGDFRKSKPYRPFIIYNDANSGGTVDGRMTTINDLYTNGLTFDLRSLTGQQLNLYFNQTGTGRNDRYFNSSFLSSKIGLLNDVLAKDNGSIWFGNVASPTSKPLNQMGTNITNKSYSTLIYSRANLEKWYPRTWQNIEMAGNSFSGNFKINADASDNTRAIARNFGSTLNESGFFNSKKSVDLVSDWLDKDSKVSDNYSRLLVKRPDIKIRNESIANVLPIETTYPFNFSDFISQNPWINALNQTQKNNLNFKFQQNLTFASYQIFSSWKNQMRMDQIGNSTKNLNAREVHNLPNQPQPNWYDNRQRNASSNPFGNVNNDVQIAGKHPLRMLLQIVKPSGNNLPTWFKTLEDQKLFDKYPLQKDAVGGETTFEQILQKFVEEKTKAIDIDQPGENLPVGLGNLRIEAFVDLNPSVISINSKKIYKKGNKRILLLNDQGQRIIYEDKYSDPWHEIYDQTATNYIDFSKYGFGSSVRGRVQTSWTSRIPATTSQIKVIVNSQLLKDNLVRKSTNEEKIFTFDYDPANNQNLIITPTDPNWLRKRLLNFQRFVNMRLAFEYQQNNSSGWQTLKTTSDSEMKSIWSSGSSTFKLPTSGVKGITKLRIRLIPNYLTSNNQTISDANSFVQFDNFSLTENKFISAAQESSVQRIVVDKNWITNKTLTNATSSLKNINTTDINKYEAEVLSQINDTNHRNAVKLVYSFDGNNNLDAASLAVKLKEKLDNFREANQGVFALWNGTNGQKLIQAKFVLKDPNSNFKLITSTSQNPTDNDLKNDVKSSIKSIIDIQPYLNDLQANPIRAVAGSNPGTISSIQMPDKSGSAGSDRFNGKTFDQIKSIFQTQANISIKFKKQDQSGNWSGWLENLTDVNTYLTNNPQFKIGFLSNDNRNIQLSSGATNLNNPEYTLNLNLPKVVKLPSENDIQTMLTNFRNANVFSGNTKDLLVDNFPAGKEIIANALISASGGGSAFDGIKSPLILNFKIADLPWQEATNLQTALQSKTTDVNDNSLKMKIALPESLNSQFILHPDLANKEFEIFPNENTTIKKFINGNNWETALKTNGITLAAGSTKDNLTYNFTTDLTNFQGSGHYSDRQVSLEYQLVGSNDNAWKQGKLPASVDGSVTSIKIRIANTSTINDNQRIYTYGPQIKQADNRATLTLDLANIPVVLRINKNWFSETKIIQDNAIISDLEQLTGDKISQWENEIWNKVIGINAVRNKVKIIYTFLNKEYDSALNLSNALIAAKRDFTNNIHHGIVQLWDGNNGTGIKIKARFEKVSSNDQSIQFVNDQNQVVDADQSKRTGFVNTANIRTTLDMSQWFTNLRTQNTVVNTTIVGQIPQGGLKPPTLTQSALFGNNNSFSDVESWLSAAGIKLFWSSSQQNPDWKLTNEIRQYDATKAKLWFAIENTSNNLILKLDGTTNLQPGNNTKTTPLEVNLKAPKQIQISTSDWSGLENIFSGNTRNIEFNEQTITNKINEILKRQGTNFANAPLSVELQIGNQGWYNYKQLKSELADKTKKPDDFTQRTIEAKFVLPANNTEFFLSDSDGARFTLKTDTNSPLKIYINNKNTFEDLQKVIPKGSDKSLALDWSATKLNVDKNTGAITVIQNQPTRAVGLKVQYTFKDNLSEVNGAEGRDPYNQWVDQQPTAFDSNRATKIYFRIQVMDSNRYVYENILDNTKPYKFEKSLDSLNKIIQVNRDWLNKNLSTGLMQINAFDLTTYENNVKSAIPQADRNKVKIVYGFNGSQQLNLDKNGVQAAMRKYATDFINDPNNNFGILKLWNGTSGVKIQSTFAINEQISNSQNYSLEWVGNNSNPMDLNTRTVISTINLTSVVTWLKTVAVGVENKNGTQNEVKNLTFKPITAQGSPFNDKTWEQAEMVLERIGIKVQYLPVFQNAPTAWGETTSAITKYDNQGKFKVRFGILRGGDGINVKLVLGNGLSDIGGSSSSDNYSNPIDVLLDIIRQIQVNTSDVNSIFINKQGAWGGNTKYFDISQSDETNLINKIKNDNHIANPGLNPSFQSAGLEMVYRIGNGNDWKRRQEFIDYLKSATDDQTTNQIFFKFRIKPEEESNSKFSVSDTAYNLNPNDNSGQKVKFFVHTGNFEKQAKLVRVSGSQDNLVWNFDSFGSGQFEEETNGEVFLKSKGRKFLRLEFTTKENPSYTDNQISNNLSDLGSKWITKKPTQIKIEEREKLFIRIKPANDGIIYQADYRENGATPNPEADVHKVQTQIQTKINIDKSWLNEISFSAQEIEIKTFNAQLLNNWIRQLRDKIKSFNKLTNNNLVDQIKLEFTFGDNQNSKYDVNQLVGVISNKLADYSSSELGIFHLWNPTIDSGIKINATFKTDNQDIVLIPTNGGLTDTLNTSKVYTLIDFNTYANRLETEPTSVVNKPNGQVGEISSFTPPAGKNPNGIFDGKSFDDIASRLSSEGIEIKYANNSNGPWLNRNQITSYNPKEPKLFISFSNKNNNNVRLSVKGTTVNPSQQNQAILTLPLAAKKLITIDTAAIEKFRQNHGLSGNTKRLTADKNRINTLISDIKNAATNNTINGIANAPLQVLFQLNNSNFMEIDQLINFLQQQPIDQTNNGIKIKFKITDGQENNWAITSPDGTYTILNPNNSTVPIFVHDSGIFEVIKNKTKITGTNTNLIWNFPNQDGFTIDSNDNFSMNSQKGKGLKLEFTIDSSLDVTAPNWGRRINNVPLGTNAVFLRIVNQNNQYIYQKTFESNNAKIQINLDQIREQINVNSIWLNKEFVANELDIKQLQISHFNAYEKNVMDQIPNLAPAIKSKLAIKYYFNNSQNPVDKNELLKLIQTYQNEETFNILQLSNNNIGIRIAATFVKADQNGAYDLVYENNDPRRQDLDTSKITTTIEFDKVIGWLTDPNTKMTIQPNPKPNKPNAIKIIIPNVVANGDPTFNGKEWNKIEKLFKNFGITIQYRPLLKTNQSNPEQGWSDDLETVDEYDQTIGKFQIRFKLDNSKTSNLKLKLNSNLIVDGNTVQKTNPFDIQLKIKLMVQINRTFVMDGFIAKPNVVGGNTKNLVINGDLEQEMIRKIKSENTVNNSAFNNVKLLVEYQLGEAQVGGQWLTREQFITNLANQNDTDQITNKIVFRFSISPDQANDFGVSQDIYTLNNHERPSDNIRVKYFVNKASWESKAENVVVSGTSSNLNFNFEQAFAPYQININNDGIVYLRNAAGNALQLQFTTKSNANYNDKDSSNNLDELATKWVNKKPIRLPAGVTSLKIRIIPTPGFIYEPATLNNDQKAKVHNVNLQIQTEIRVDRNWFQEIPLVITKTEIKTIDVRTINQWIEKIRQKIITTNNISAQLAGKVKIEFKYNGQNTKLDAQKLFDKLHQEYTNFNNSDLGILQLWNGNKGVKIQAIFSAQDNSVIVQSPNNSTNEADLSNDINLTNIFTEINLVKFIENAINEKVQVERDANTPIGQMKNFILKPLKTPNGAQFVNKNFEEIETVLKKFGINIVFSHDKTTWVEKNNLKQYNPQTAQIFMAFRNSSGNLEVKISNSQTVINGANNENQPIILPLNVPKQISIDPTKDNFNNLPQLLSFRGHTKVLEFQQNEVSNLIQRILERNKTETNDNSFISAKLKLHFSIGQTDFKESSELINFLKSKDQDLKDRSIKFKFVIDPSDADNFVLANPNQAYDLFTNDNSPLKIYINDRNLFDDLSKPSLDGSTSADLRLNWSNKKITIEPTTGVINATDVNNNSIIRGKGLKVEFSYKKDLTGAKDEPVNTDPFKGWSPITPRSFDANISNQLLLRVLVVNDIYTYDNVYRKTTIDLSQIPTIININAAALNQIIVDNEITIADFLSNTNKFNDYETKVWTAANLGQVDRANVRIAYSFDKSDYRDLTQLINAIKNYKNTHQSDPNLGILQLWNKISGEKISTKFVKADENGNYKLNITGDNNFDLDLSKVVTTIDFSAVLSWLKTLEVGIEEGPNYTITKLKMPNISIADPYFGSKSWETTEQALSSFGIIIEYSNNLSGQNESWGSINSVNQYNPKAPTFKIRFRTDGNKSKNIKFKIEQNTTINGASSNVSNGFVLNLKAHLLVEIPSDKLSQFISSANISGNTKFIKIDSAKQAEKTFIDEIIKFNKANDPRYSKLEGQLELQYAMQLDTPNNTTVWNTLDNFKNYLESLNQDQTTNKIWFKIILKNNTDFTMAANDLSPKVLSDHQASTAQNLRIKYYVNASDWERRADSVEISGPSDNLSWNLATAFGNIAESSNKVYLRTNAGQALQVYFTLDRNANYDNPALSDNPADLKTHWVSIKPNAIPAGTADLKIKIVANTGFVYGPTLETETNKKAKAHNVRINVQNVIYVDKMWFSNPLVTNDIDVNSLNKQTHFNPWETNIYQQLATRNGVSDEIARKIKIKYILNGVRYEAQQLIDQFNRLKQDFGGNDLGIIKLWNNQDHTGSKIEAIFESGDSNYVIRVANNQGQPTEEQIKSLINTDRIYTSISMINYLEILKSEEHKTKVEKDPSKPQPGFISSFTPPDMIGKIGSGFLAGKTYEQIASRLNSLGVKIEFTKDPTLNNWGLKETIKSYDIQKNDLFMAFTITSKNIRIQLNNNDILMPDQNNKDRSIKLPLAVKKYILINNTKTFWQDIKTKFAFSGTTKKLTYQKNKIDEFLNAIKQDNFANSAGDNSYKNAPLEIEFQIGNLNFVNINDLNNYLNQQRSDLPNRLMRMKFAITKGQENNWEVIDEKTGTNDQYEFLSDRDPLNKIKIFINDNNNFDALQKMKLQGTQDALIWPWPFGPNGINENTGILTPQTGGFGKGLKLQFSFNESANLEGNDPETQWSQVVPKSFKPKYNKVWVRIKLTDENLYVYDHTNKKFALSLDDIPKIIKLDGNWLIKRFKDGVNFDANDLNETIISEYEQKINESAMNDQTNPVDASLLNKFSIKYQFNSDGEWISKTQLLGKIQKYKENKNQDSLGILQLWNKKSGVKIQAQFTDANLNDNYSIEVINDNEHIIDTTNVETHIDFSKVMKWIQNKTTLIGVDPGQTENSINGFRFPVYTNNTDLIFDGIEWNKIEKAFTRFGINLEYRAKRQNGAGSFGPQSSVTSYDPTLAILEFQLRFDEKAENIFIKWDEKENEIQAQNGIIKGPFETYLDVPLTFVIKDDLVNDLFIQVSNVIGGDTKNIQILESAQNNLLNKIIETNAQNNPIFADAKNALTIEYYLGDDKKSKGQWKELNQFKTDLANDNKDQKSNKVLFRFAIKNINNYQDKFSVSDKSYILHNPDGVSPENWKVKFYINDNNWEDNAANITISGTSSKIKWNYESLLRQVSNAEIIKESGSSGNKIFVKLNGFKALQVQFSTKRNIQYNEPNASDNLTDLNNKWVTVEPTNIPAQDLSHLYIRLVAQNGFVYGPQKNNKAIAHRMDESNLKLEILVNPNNLNRSLTISQKDAYVTDIQKSDLAKYVEEVIQTIEPSLSQHVIVTFSFNGKEFKLSNTANDQSKIIDLLYEEIQNIINNKTGKNHGILQLWNGNNGKKIESRFDLANPNGNYILVDQRVTNPDQSGNPKELKTIQTGHIKTLIDLKSIVQELKKLKINIQVNNKNQRQLISIVSLLMPNIPNGTDSGLQGLSWENFEQALLSYGVIVQARPIVAKGQPEQQWKKINKIKNYDDTTLKLELRFAINPNEGSNIVLSVIKDKDVEATANIPNNLPTFEMILNAPARVVVDPNLLTEFITNNQTRGNTKHIVIDRTEESALITAIINANKITNEQIFSQLDGRLEIQYFLGQNIEQNTIWKNRSDFEKFLSEQSQDQITNKIWYRLNIKNTGENGEQIFNIDQSPNVLLNEQINEKASVKIFINDNGYEAKINQLKAVGSTDDFIIQNKDLFEKAKPNGLEIWWSNQKTPGENDDNEWSKEVPKILNSDKDLWIRFKSNDGYVYENAIKNGDIYTKYSNKKSIDTEGLKVILKLKKEWLNLIKITNNTKDPNISENDVLQKIKEANILPSNKPDLIQLRYRIKGTNEWLLKDDFTNKLKKLLGAKDENNFILKREELELKFAISNNEDQYGLNIDGQNITNDNENQYYLDLIDDNQKRNDAFEGYINLDKIKEFVKDNFKIQGSTSKPRFIVTNREKLDNYFIPYATDNLFDIQYSTQYNSQDNTWNWDEHKSILNNGHLIEEDGLFGQTTIGADKKFALRFISKNKKYSVYKNDKKQDEGYILDLSENVKITVEITNPFTASNKTLGLWTRDENKKAKYFQGEGGFKIVVANKTDFAIDPNNIKSAQEFLEESQLLQNEKNAIEFVYHIFDSNPTQDEINRIKNSINDHNSKDWVQFKSKTKTSDYWSDNLNLKVGDYVAVAIRIKKEFTTGENIFVLKDNDHSMVLPIMNDQNGVQKKTGRISGYKIKTEKINVDNASIILSNMVNPELPPLDGWTLLSKLNLIPDENDNYLGVNLKLQLYNEYYTKPDGSIWISGSGQKLVKRQSNGEGIISVGTYTDGAGNPINDTNGQPIQIYKDNKTKRLSSPTKSSNIVKEEMLENLGNGSFHLIEPKDKKEKGKLSLFKNQDIEIKLIANNGEGSSDLPDFYLDDESKVINLRNVISPKIKFAIENEKQITYEWNYDDFNVDKIEYQGINNRPPEDGNAQIKTIYKLFRKQPFQDEKDEITGNNFEEAIKNLSDALNQDFAGQLKFQIVRLNARGGETIIDGNNIYQFKDLKNKDRIILKIVAVENDLYYAEAPRPLIINVRGLTEAAPNQEKLQHLRVLQSGNIDGQGSFKVLVSNPTDPNEDDASILKGWKFMIRVWDKDETLDEHGKRKIKINWTDEQQSIRNLSNGDKVEWKLVSEDGNPVKDAYYNTIALEHKNDPIDGSVKYQFAKVNYQKGNGEYQIIEKGIGKYPNDDQYPENSGFVISGLQKQFEAFKITKSIFDKILGQLEPSYIGLNTQGTINFNPKFFEKEYWVNTNGEIYLKNQSYNTYDNSVNELIEIPLIDFIKHITFYTKDPFLVPSQNGFKFSGNDININNHLSNGDQMWAKFDMLESVKNSKFNDDLITSIVSRLSDVNGLKEIIDPMSPLWYVLMALAGIATLGTAALIAFLVSRHKKLKGKN